MSYLSQAEERMRAGHPEEAVPLLAKATVGSRSADLWRMYGDALSATLRHEPALKAFVTAGMFEPGNADLWCRAAEAAAALRRDQDAADHLRRALGVDPDLFLRRADLLPLWRRCRPEYAYEDAAAVLGASRDPAAAAVYLRRVLAPEDVRIALEPLGHIRQPLVPARLARATLSASVRSYEVSVLADLAAGTRDGRPEVPDEVLAECVERAATLSRDRDSLLLNLAAESPRLALFAQSVELCPSRVRLVALTTVMADLHELLSGAGRQLYA